VIAREGSIQLDVVVTDAQGKPVIGLEPWDFKVLDNERPAKILTFRAFDGVAMKPDPVVEVILVLDLLNLPFQQVAVVRDQVEQYLRENGGRLAQPTLIMLLTDKGLRVQQQPSVDGKAQVEIVQQIQANISSINPAMGGFGMVERFQRSVRQVTAIAENEVKSPGRKLLIWVGPGWPLLNHEELGHFSAVDQQRYFEGVVELTNRLREARIAVYSVSPMQEGGTVSTTYESFLKPVRTGKDADSGYLALKVLALESGGEIFGPDNNLAAQIDRCVADANAFYRISFNSPAAAQPNEYHELKVTVGRSGLTVRTNAGYYNQPPGQ